jgi:hypothetical protein
MPDVVVVFKTVTYPKEVQIRDYTIDINDNGTLIN